MLETPGINNQTLPVDDGRPVRRIRVPAATVLGQAPRVLHHLTAVLCVASTGPKSNDALTWVTPASVRIPNTTPTARRTPFAFTWCPSTTLTVATRDTRECIGTVLQISQTRSLLTHLHLRKTKVIVSVITSYVPQTHTVQPVLLN